MADVTYASDGAAEEVRQLSEENPRRSLLYLLRCVDTMELGTAEQIGIGYSFLVAAGDMGYLVGKEQFALSDKGRALMLESGGEFKHSHSLRSYTPLANRAVRSAADGYGGR